METLKSKMSVIRNGLFLFACLLVFSNCKLSKESIVLADKLQLTRQICHENVLRNHYPGLSVSISKDDKIIFSEGFGYANVEEQIAVDPSKSLFRIGSISKAITAVALAQLVEGGEIQLDSAIQKYVPYFPEKKYPVTVRQVALHTGGIRHYAGLEFFLNRSFETVEEGISIFKDDPLLFEPGTQYQYSSYGWNLLSAVIEGASHLSFLNYMNQRIFNHPDLECLQADHATEEIQERVKFYQLSDNHEAIECMPVDNSYKWAGGGFLSCSEDLVDFGRAVLNNDWIAEDTRNYFWEKGTFSDGSVTERGLGWASEIDEFGRAWVGHGGGSMGGSSILLIYPKEKLVVAMLINLSSAKWGGLPFKVADIILRQESSG